MQITRLDVPQCSVGKGPVWDVQSQRLYCIDILEKSVHCLDPATGGKLVRFRPDGSIERIITMPLKLPGSMMFGGPQLDRLFVPTLSPAFLGRPADPLDGSTFVIDGLGVQGLPEPRFGT